MGLDITAYSHLTHIGQHTKEPDLNQGEPGGLTDRCYYDNHLEAFAYDIFPASFRGLPVLHADQDSVFGGCYEITDQTVQHGFRAGAYTGYNQWRSDLQRQFNRGRNPDGPFYELIWFADNEGCIGPDAAADLLADFRQHADQYKPYPDGSDSMQSWCRGRYADWTRACELAADGGLIRFH